MKRTALIFLLLLLVVIIADLPVAAQTTGPHVIKGTVYVPGDRPAQRSEVVLENSTGMQVARTFTDEDGRYAFSGVGFGNYRVVVPAFGRDYAPAWQEVEISGSRDSIIFRTIDLHLQPKKGASSGPPSTLSAFTQEIPKLAEDEFKKGIRALEKGSGEKGIAHLKRAIELFPDYYLALARLGSEYARAGQYEMAVPLLRRASAVNRKSSTSHVTLGMSLIELGQYAEAIKVLTVGKSLDARSVNAHLYLGIAQVQVEELSQAEENLRRAYELGGAGRAAIAHLHLASIYDRQRKFRRAADELEEYLKDVPAAKNSGKIQQLIDRLRRKGEE